MNLKPLRGYCLIEQIDDTEVRASGIVMPETAKDKPMKGVVLEVGEGIMVHPGVIKNVGSGSTQGIVVESHPTYLNSPVKEGDKVVFKKWATNDLEEDGKKLAFVKFEDILGVYE